MLTREGGFDLVAPSPISLSHSGEGEVVPPREFTAAELKEYVEMYIMAASNAIEAGFDGVEVHAANGYLPPRPIFADGVK